MGVMIYMYAYLALATNFILYNDGLLVFLKDGQYWQSFLSQDKITDLFDQLTNTGLFLHSVNEYRSGNSELELNGKDTIFRGIFLNGIRLSWRSKLLFIINLMK